MILLYFVLAGAWLVSAVFVGVELYYAPVMDDLND